MDWRSPAHLLIFLAPLVTAVSSGCAGSGATRSGLAAGTPQAADEAVQALQASEFDGANEKGNIVLETYPGNARARAVAALTLYKQTMHTLMQDVRTVALAAASGMINHRYLRYSLEQAEIHLVSVEGHLAVAAADPDFSLDLCLACWENDWNHDGHIDGRDRKLFQVEIDADGSWVPEGDPRRKPTFRFDTGDIHWARAMVSFQRTVLNILLAYQWTEVDRILKQARRGDLDALVITIRMGDPGRIHKARELFLAGLEHASEARQAYLVEQDDEREWVPNPRQKNHPLPLPVDEKLYDTWGDVLIDLHYLVEGKTGISVEQIAQLGDHQWQEPPQGYIHIGRLFEEPGDLVISLAHIKELDRDRTREDVERVLTDLFGKKYVPKMEDTELVTRLMRMKEEIRRGEESLERKLRYLLWLN